jgi:hypothetical protein
MKWRNDSVYVVLPRSVILTDITSVAILAQSVAYGLYIYIYIYMCVCVCVCTHMGANMPYILHTRYISI